MSTNVDAVRDLRAALYAVRDGERTALEQMAYPRQKQPGAAGRLWRIVFLAVRDDLTPVGVYSALAAAPRVDRERIALVSFIARQHFARVQAPGYAALFSAIAEAAKAATAAEDEVLRAALPDEPRAAFVPEHEQFLDAGDDGPIAA